MKVAILIPTLNRPSFVKRIVLYYDSLKSNHPLYIGDASSIEISKNTLAFLKDVKNHIKTISNREYIDPSSGTLDYVLMFFPNQQIVALVCQCPIYLDCLL